MDGQISVHIDGRLGGWVNGWTEVWNAWMGHSVDGQLIGFMNE